jgi:CheY-like chemotaxis protein
LVVEDHEDTAATMGLLLGLFGHVVQAAPDGQVALELAQADPPDVVLLDLALPGMDGYQVARRLREQAGRRRPLLVAITGYGREEDRQRSREAGIDLHLVKPVDSELLAKILARFQAVVCPS